MDDKHLPIFLVEMYREGRIDRKDLDKYKDHIDSCDFCSDMLKICDKELKCEFIP